MHTNVVMIAYLSVLAILFAARIELGLTLHILTVSLKFPKVSFGRERKTLLCGLFMTHTY